MLDAGLQIAPIMQCPQHIQRLTRIVLCPVWQIAQLAAEVDIPAFVPKAGVQIETDPKATSAKPAAAYDDEAIIEGMIANLQVSHMPCKHAAIRMFHA